MLLPQRGKLPEGLGQGRAGIYLQFNRMPVAAVWRVSEGSVGRAGGQGRREGPPGSADGLDLGCGTESGPSPTLLLEQLDRWRCRFGRGIRGHIWDRLGL